MSYLVLARKYRPRRFADVAGQDVVTGVLSGAIKSGRVGHAYLFFGPRGTGKTTSARLFAKALNCERRLAERDRGEAGEIEPCGECERCRSFDEDREVDIVEIDAASNTQVDFIRDLRDQAAYAPMRARHKIYIIDEVHMLSKAAFNALLKTLEEPPPHVKFLFATTELHKVPDTIVSRCGLMRLSPIPEDVIAARLDEVLAAEDVSPEEGVTAELARRARGGMRDALSLADQLLALVGTSPTVADLARLSGDSGGGAVERVLAALEAGDRAAVLRALPERSGTEAELLAGLLDELRGALVCAACGKDAPMLAADERARARLEALGKRLGPGRLELWLADLLAARERVQLLSGQARIVLEVALLELCRPEAGEPLGALLARLEALEARLDAGASAGPPVTGTPPATARARGPAASPAGPEDAAASRAAPEDAAASPAGAEDPAASRGGPAHPAASPSDPEDPAERRANGPRSDRAPASPESSIEPLPAEPAQVPAQRPASERAPGPASGPAEAGAGGAPGVASAPAEPCAQASARPSAEACEPDRAPAAATAVAAAPRSEPRAARGGFSVRHSTADAWTRFLEELEHAAPALGGLLRERGTLVEFDPPRVVVKLRGLRAGEDALVADERNRRLCDAACARALGEPVEVRLEDAASARPGRDDPFTREVAELFGGRIEDD